MDAPFNSIDKALFFDDEGREIGDLGLQFGQLGLGKYSNEDEELEAAIRASLEEVNNL